jgi:hypothetical protein
MSKNASLAKSIKAPVDTFLLAGVWMHLLSVTEAVAGAECSGALFVLSISPRREPATD